MSPVKTVTPIWDRAQKVQAHATLKKIILDAWPQKFAWRSSEPAYIAKLLPSFSGFEWLKSGQTKVLNVQSALSFLQLGQLSSGQKNPFLWCSKITFLNSALSSFWSSRVCLTFPPRCLFNSVTRIAAPPDSSYDILQPWESIDTNFLEFFWF